MTDQLDIYQEIREVEYTTEDRIEVYAEWREVEYEWEEYRVHHFLWGPI